MKTLDAPAMADTHQHGVAQETAFAAAHVAVKYRPDIDGLRAVAVLSVIGFHAFHEWLPGGFVGVDIFFVISGYLISSIIFEQVQQGRFSIANFYSRRIKRIFPSLLVILVACGAMGWYVLYPHEFKELGKHIAGGAGFSSNFVLWREAGYFDASADSKPLLHLWSLGIEEQFYFLWPAIIYLAWRRGMSVVGALLLLLGASFALNLAFLGSKAVATFYLPFTRMWELLAGALLAHFAGSRSAQSPEPTGVLVHLQSFAGGALIMGSLFALDRYVAFPGWAAVVPVLGAYLLIAAGPRGLLNQHVLSRPVFVWLGLISFPLYLWHWPLLAFPYIVEGGRPGLAVRVIAVGASVVLAWATYQFVEKKLRFRPGAERPLFVGCFIVLLVGLGVWQGWVSPRHHSAELQRVTDAIADWKYPPDSFSRLDVDGQRFYARAGAAGKKVVFIGDSDLQQYAGRIERLLDTAPASIKSTVLTMRGGCPPIPGVVTKSDPTCQPILQAATRLAESEDVDTVVVGACWYCYLHHDPEPNAPASYDFVDGNLRYSMETTRGIDLALRSFEAFVHHLASKKKVFVVLSSPVGDKVNPRNLLKGSRLGQLEYQRAAGMEEREFQALFGAMNERLRRIAIAAGAAVIDPLPSMCPGGNCSALTAEGLPIYRDGVHIRASFAREHATFMDPTVQAAGREAAR